VRERERARERERVYIYESIWMVCWCSPVCNLLWHLVSKVV
jgi:hypothetical protein